MNLNTKQNRAARQLAALSSSLKLCLTGTALVWGLAASAQTATTTTNFTVDAMVRAFSGTTTGDYRSAM